MAQNIPLQTLTFASLRSREKRHPLGSPLAFPAKYVPDVVGFFILYSRAHSSNVKGVIATQGIAFCILQHITRRKH
jgi:hypothetical protein